MAAGSRDRPPMLATGRYPQWRSRFLRYIDTRPNGDALRKCILSGPYKPTTVLVQAVAATDDSPAIPKHTTEMWEAIERLQQEWSRFVMIVKQQHKLDKVSYRKLFDILKQYQKEVNELCAERLARNANPLALVATTQANQDPYYQNSKPHKSYAPSSKPSISTKTHKTTIHKGKDIAKPITPLSEIASEEDSNPEQAQRDKDMQKNLALIAKYFKKIYKPTNKNLITSSNSKNKNVDTTPRYKNDNQSGQFGNQRMECKKPKRVKDFAYHKEKTLLCKQAEQSVPLQAEQYDWLANTDEEIDEQELEAQYSYMAKIQENKQNDVESDDECVKLANIIANLKLDVDENKKIQNQLNKSNTTLAQELKTEFEKYKAFNNHTIDYDKLERKLNEALGQLALEIKAGLKTKTYEILVVKEEHDELIKQSLLTKSHYEGLVKQKTKPAAGQPPPLPATRRRKSFPTNPKVIPRLPIYSTHHHHLRRCPATLTNEPLQPTPPWQLAPPWQQPPCYHHVHDTTPIISTMAVVPSSPCHLPPSCMHHHQPPLPHSEIYHHRRHHSNNDGFLAAAAAVAGCGWRIGHHRRGGA
nr:hypothetical protein [Tanacetum cinerariifolium]